MKNYLNTNYSLILTDPGKKQDHEMAGIHSEPYFVVGDRLQDRESASRKGTLQRQGDGLITQREEGKEIPSESGIV